MSRESPSPGESRENGLEEQEEQEELDEEHEEEHEEDQEEEHEEEHEEDQEDQDQEEGDLDDEQDASQLERFLRDRRRAKSLPAYPALLPGRKRVQFADSMGLNLASVKHFSSMEEPRVPSKVLSRYRSFPPPQQEPLGDRGPGSRSRLDPGRLVACFPEPRDPERRVRQLRVCLEKITISRFDVRGHIRVFGGGSAREVGVRYTFNDWRSCVDAQALVLDLEEPGLSLEEPGLEDPVLSLEDPVLVGERFSFTVYPPPCMQPGSAVHFALYLRTRDGEFWDNNQGQNYSLRYRGPPGPTSHGCNAFHAI